MNSLVAALREAESSCSSPSVGSERRRESGRGSTWFNQRATRWVSCLLAAVLLSMLDVGALGAQTQVDVENAVPRAVRVSIQGRVLDQSGAPLPRSARPVRVLVRSSTTRWASYSSALLGREAIRTLVEAEPDDQGFFRLDVDLSGAAHVVVQAVGRGGMERLVLPAPSEQTLPTLHLWPAQRESLYLVSGPGQERLQLEDSRSWVQRTALTPEARARQQWANTGWQRVRSYGWSSPSAGRPGMAIDGEGSVTGHYYEFDRVPGEAQRFVVSQPGGLEEISVGPGADANEVRHRPRDATPRHLFVRSEQAPLEGVVALVDGRPVGPSDNQGRIELLAAPDSRVRLLHRRHQGSWRVLEQVSSGAATEVTIEPWQRVSGRVREAITGAALPGAWLLVAGQTVRAGRRGEFDLFAPPDAEVLVGLEGFTWRRIGQDDLAMSGQLQIELERSSFVSGRVVDDRDRAQRGIEVEILPAGGGSHDGSAEGRQSARFGRTDAAGEFRIRGLRAGSEYLLRAQPADGRRTTVAAFTTPQTGGAAPSQVLRLRWPRAAMGWVVDHEERPVKGARVLVAPAHRSLADTDTVRDAEGRPKVESVVTDDNGRYFVDDLPSLFLNLFVQVSGHAPASRVDVEVPDVAPGQVAEIGTFVLGESISLDLELLDREHRPVPGAVVLYRGDHRRWSGQVPARGLLSTARSGGAFVASPLDSDEEGKLRIDDLGIDETVDLMIEHPDFASRSIERVLLPQREPLRVVLRRAARISGRAVDERGAGLGNAHVALRSADAGVRMDGDLRSRTNESGEFVLERVPPGRLVVWGRASGAPDFVEVPVLLEEGQHLEDVLLRLPPNGRLEGRVRRAGTPVPGAQIRCCGLGTEADESGAFSLDRVPAGLRVVRAYDREGAAGEAEIEVVEGRTTELDLDLAEGLVIAGSLRASDQREVQGGMVLLRRIDRSFGNSIPTRAPGGEPSTKFRYEGLRPGRYVLQASGTVEGERINAERELNLERDELNIDLVLGGSAAISGRVLGLRPEQLERVSLWIRSEEAATRTARLQEEEYSFERVEPGTWFVRARVFDGPSVEQRVELADGEHRVVDLEFPDRPVSLRLRVAVTDAPSSAWIVGYGPEGQLVSQSINETGEALLEGLAAGQWNLSIADAQTALVPVWSGSVRGDQTLDLRLRRAEVFGEVIDGSSARPLQGAEVSVVGERAETIPNRSRRVTSADGQFSLRVLVEDHYRVLVSAPGYESQEIWTTGDGAPMRLTLLPAPQAR